MLRTHDVLHESSPDLPHHALAGFHWLSDVVGNGLGHALEVDTVAVGHFGHGGGGVDVCAGCGDSVDLRLHDLQDALLAIARIRRLQRWRM
jgi:hypothetical protein